MSILSFPSHVLSCSFSPFFRGPKNVECSRRAVFDRKQHSLHTECTAIKMNGISTPIMFRRRRRPENN